MPRPPGHVLQNGSCTHGILVLMIKHSLNDAPLLDRHPRAPVVGPRAYDAVDISGAVFIGVQSGCPVARNSMNSSIRHEGTR